MTFGELLFALLPLLAMAALLAGAWWVWPKGGRPPWRRS